MNINVEIKNDVAVVTIEGSITSANSNQFSQATEELPGQYDGVIIDALDLDHISSAGLRVVLGIKKRCGNKPFKVINVNTEVMNIFDMTGFSEIMDIQSASRQLTVEGCEVIGKGACGECYRIDDETIIKLYYGGMDISVIEHEKALSKKAFVMGIPTAISYDIVEADGRKGVVYELIKSKTLGELMRSDDGKLDEYIEQYVDICKTVHSITTKDPEIPSFKDINREDIPNVTGITDEEREYLYRFLDLVPDMDNCIHGDLNINNVMVQDGECCLIDMGELSTGIPMFDISRILFSMIYAAPENEEFYPFYKMPTKKVEYIYNQLFKGYFGCDTIEEAQEKDPNVKWLLPLTWFRCVTSLLKGNRWPEEKRQMALDLLRNKLIPLVDSLS